MLGPLLYLLFAGALAALTLVAFVSAARPTPLPARWAIPLVGVWAASLAVMTLRPGSGLGMRLNLVPILFDGPGSAVDAVLNVAVFVPFGLLLAAAAVRFRTTFAVALAITLTIEVTQYLADTGRTADINDVLTNVAGACLGWAMARAIRALATRAAAARTPTAPARP
ncbi:VanZ family protein [Herbiconiux sp. CPCC 205763]|uniref:VanZ family protein n=1 Tax=Herbiconiux aconitum TaxID=2970913 RepID=A0ABT2GL15_9MICO|nr:VanZ family protein [Herbiconiux aconitum]MCS5716905.1 VanZ family protein [Herbiconiux aconitum]